MRGLSEPLKQVTDLLDRPLIFAKLYIRRDTEHSYQAGNENTRSLKNLLDNGEILKTCVLIFFLTISFAWHKINWVLKHTVQE